MVLAVKLALTVAIMVGVGWILVSSDPEGQIAESQADIVALQMRPKSDTQRFRDALDNLGHEPAQAFELNGNRILFSVNNTDESPQQVLRAYQDEFVAQQLNDQTFTTLSMAEMAARKRTSFSGGIVPLKLSPEHIIMGGVSTRGGSKTTADLVGEFDASKTPAELFNAFRWIEITRSNNNTGSTVTATWSNENFDYDAMFPRPKASQSEDVDERVPVCPKCLKVNQFADESRPGTHETYVFTTSLGPYQLRSFYQETLQRRGWQLDERSQWLDELRVHLDFEAAQMDRLEFRRDDQTLEVAIYPLESKRNAVRLVLLDEKHLNAKGLTASPAQ
jgi:hypothetical protein